MLERILFLGGNSRSHRLAKLGSTTLDQFLKNLAIQHRVVPALNDVIVLCREHRDAGRASMLETLLVGEDEHTGWLETQLELIEQIGQRGYLAQHLTPRIP